jgi:hypothetical protein
LGSIDNFVCGVVQLDEFSSISGSGLKENFGEHDAVANQFSVHNPGEGAQDEKDLAKHGGVC